MDIARGELVEKELDAMTERRSRKGEVDPDEREEFWKESVRRFSARRREANRQAWQQYHEGQVVRHKAVLESLIAHHEAEASMLTEPKGDAA